MIGYRRLGASGLKVSRLALGTATFGLQTDEASSVAIMDQAADRGITFFDTADSYPFGAFKPARLLDGGALEATASFTRSEEIVGRWLKGRRDNFIVATKGFMPTGTLPFQRGNSRRHLLNAAEQSLCRLGTDYIDLYQLHDHDPETPLDETLEALDFLVRSGKVRYVGCSNHLSYQLARALGRSELLGVARFVSVQSRFNLLFREFERELFPLCTEEGVGVISYNALAGGLLSGKYETGAPDPKSRFGRGDFVGAIYRDRYWDERKIEVAGRLGRIADDLGTSLPSLAIAWVLANPIVTSCILGASKVQQLTATLDAADIDLSAQTLADIDALTREFRRGDAAR